MRTETESAAGAHLKVSAQRGSDQTPPLLRRQRRVLWLGVLAWAAFVGFALWLLLKDDGGLSVWVFQERELNQPGFSEKVQSLFRGEFGLLRIYPWMLFGPFVALVTWYFPLERERLHRNLPLNLAACLAFLTASQVLHLYTTETRPRFVVVDSDRAPGIPSDDQSAESDDSIHVRRLPPPSPTRSRKISLRSTILDLLAYGAIAGLVHSVNFYGRLRERERRALFLESNLAKARLNTLKAQLHPHFLFNSLNAITALLRRDPRQAETTLVALSELLRLALSQSEKQEVALREELQFVQRYLEIQQTRFGDKLRVEQDIDPQALDCLVPTLVLQPLVENAIRHGIEPSDMAGLVRLSASRKDDQLVLVVEDNGIGLAGDPARSEPRPSGSVMAGTGIGLANLRERLRALYGSAQKLELLRGANGGALVRVEIPWHPRAKTAPSFET